MLNETLVPFAGVIIGGLIGFFPSLAILFISNKLNKENIEKEREFQFVKELLFRFEDNEKITRFISFAHYVEAEGEFHKKYGKFAIIKNEGFISVHKRFSCELVMFWETFEKIKKEGNYATDAVSAFENALRYFLEHPSFKDEAGKMVEQIKETVGDDMSVLCQDIRIIAANDQK